MANALVLFFFIKVKRLGDNKITSEERLRVSILDHGSKHIGRRVCSG